MPYVKEPIAVIGSGCRFPGGSSNPSRLWDLLRDPRDVQSRIDRFRADNFYNQDGHYHGASNVLSAYLLSEDTKKFDAQFFNIPLSEAEAIDPQQRLLLETVYESLEAAGLSMESLSGSNAAVYVGVMCDDFSQIVYGDSENIPTYAATGSARSILSNRISYFFNWHGPSMTIDTACSSSLIAVHQAVHVLRSGEAPVAIASGTNLIFGPTMFVAESNLNMLSPTGRSRMWDAGANGYARGEGVGSIVMKTLSAALRDGDHIEYIIRETGINQDGKTPGITMPSSELQACLIRDTYARAGLDPCKRDERCQYFEAHGTGTPAGDPREAGAIYQAFFSHQEKGQAQETGPSEDESGGLQDTLLVGSIKTIIGHTEGTAGIAGLMKAALAIQNSAVPPNMHFTKLNPELKPYYNNLMIPIHLREWPETANGVPRRASVNSFGFGGANAHAIIESYEPEIQHPAISVPRQVKRLESSKSMSTPHVFVFSAASSRSLTAQLKSYLSFLEENPGFDADALFWSLFRRTAHNFRVSFAAPSIQALRLQIAEALEQAETSKTPLGLRVSPKTPRAILGVFTGQGAQWATMGRQLVLSSHFAKSVLEDLERSLSELPTGDAPDWSLKAELLAPKEHSRIAEGVISQPLCTAVQILVVKLLRRAGISFSAVVGHSSGEITCAYVSGFLSARDAIRVAYYRGKYTPLAKTKAGAMIAVGTDMQDAVDMCGLPKLKNKAQLAASNSSASVTISGDADAIKLVETVAQDESKFARTLKVDTAYHSHHMAACSGPYIDSLRRCGIQVTEPSADACAWYTSVSENNERVTMSMASVLKDQYWADNMLQPVLFSQALTAAVGAEGPPGVVLEVGPHPALKGPASLTIEEAVGPVPYFGTLLRGKDDAIAILATLGSIWSVLGASAIPSMRDLQLAYSADAEFSISKDLPSYAWDHERVVWSETRVCRAHRLRSEAKHELLGVRDVNIGEGERRWRNYLKPKEMPWLRGHQIQGQMVFPAAGYAVMALEAARTLAPSKGIRLMQLQKFSIHKAISFMDDTANIETLFCLSDIQQSSPDAEGLSYVSANFACHACLNKDAGDFVSMAGGQIKLTVGQGMEEDGMPSRPRWVNNFVDTDVAYFYECLAELGYGYQGMFQGITDLRRTNGGSKGTIMIPQDDGEDESMPQNWVIHPATLDVAFQAVFAAVGAPGDGRLWTLHVPTMIDSITVNPSAYEMSLSGGVATPLPFDAFVVDSDQQDGIAGDVDLYDEDGRRALVQIQGLHVTPLTKATADDDRETFASISWDLAAPDLVSGWSAWSQEDGDQQLARFAERLSLCILRDLCGSLSGFDVERSGTAHQRSILEWARHVVHTTRSREHPTCLKEWLADTWELLEAPAQRLAKTNAQIRHCLAIREYLTPFMSNQLSPQSELEFSQLWDGYYATIPGYHQYLERLAGLVDQLAFTHRNMRVLEIGTGKGQCTKALLDVLGQNFASYTCTDAEATDFDLVRSQISASQAERMRFKTLDLEQSPADQDFVAGHYDLVVASNALHTTADLDEMLRQIRTLVRPGGYLALLEPTSSSSLAVALGGCALPEWFSGIEEDRKYSPFATHEKWDEVLRASGFSGLDTATPEEQTFSVPYSVMCSMAVDKQMDMIREPLSHAGQTVSDANLLIIGGRTVHTRNLVRDLKRTLAPFFHNVMQAETLLDVDDETIATQPTTICLAELDELLFKPFTEDKFKAIVKICDSMQTMLWVTIGCRGENPYMNMMVAVGRCLVGEMPNLRLQFLNFDGSDRPTSNVVAHHLLRLHLSSSLSGEPRKPNEPLYLIEREVSIQNGTLLVPRYLPVGNINARLNSDKRLIIHDVDHSRTAVAVDSTASQYRLLENAQLPDPARATVEISVTKSLLNAVRIGATSAAGCLHLLMGSIDEGRKKVVALSGANQSIVWVPRSHIVELDPSDLPDFRETSMLDSIATELLATAVLAGTSGAVIVHEPFPALARSLRRLAASKGVTLSMTSVSSSNEATEETTPIHPTCPDRILARTVPKDLAVLVDLSNTVGSTDRDTIGSRIEKFVPRGCEIRKASHLFSSKAYGFNTKGGDSDAADALAIAVQRVLQQRQPEHDDSVQHEFSHVIAASAVPSLEPLQSIPFLQTINWKADATLPVSLRPTDESMRFRSDRTYFLVGLTGELGLQLTKWMVKRGAKYLALASREPQLDPDWLELVQSEGAVVNSYAMDVTSRTSVRTAHQRLCAEMPPVAGVMNGAMILIDGLFANKTYAEFNKTLRPKVDGTVHLDEVFNSKDLDFFIVFSSLACVSGNMGQTAYAAANAFMCSLIAGRRMRGLAGSSINMPGIVGLGYLNRDTRKLDRLKNLGYVNISEWDFYQFLSEAIAAGRPDSGMIPEITAGLKKLQVEGGHDLPLWSKTPRFHWLRIPVSSTADGAADGDKSNGGSSVRSRLADVTSEEELRKLLLDGLLGTLYARLNMSPDEQGITPDTAIVQLGVDSLLAVDMRSWFTKELDLDMPVLKILGGATLYDLVDNAMSRLAPELVPNLAGSAADADATTDSGSEQQQQESIETSDSPTIEDVDAEAEDTEAPVVDAEGENQQEHEMAIMAPIELPPFDDDEILIGGDEAFADAQSSKYASTDAEDLDKIDQQSDTTQPTSQSEGSSDYVKVEFGSDMGGGDPGRNTPCDEEHQPSAKLFSQFQESFGNTRQPDFVKKASMSYGTSRFWFLMQYLRDPTTFNLLCHVKFTGHIRFDDADRCIEDLGNRHEVFRTCFFADPENLNEPTMGVMEKTYLRLERRFAESEADVDAEGDELIKYDFKIEQGETIRMKLISLPDSTHHLLFGFHHIILDGFSFNLLLAELNPLYDGQPLPPVKTTFSEFASRQRQQVTDGSLEGNFQFWKNVYSMKLPSGETKSDFPEPLPLFNLARSPRRSLDVYEFHESSLILDARTNRQIKAQCRRHKITPFHFFLGVLRMFLGRHLGVDDLVIGVADANRIDSSLDSTVGFMLNLLPLRFKNDKGNNKEQRFKDVAQTTRDTVYDALAHSALPFDALLERLDVPRSATHSPLFQVWMDYRPIKPGNRPTLFGSEANGTQTVGRNGYDLTLDITELDDLEPRVSFRTQKYLYSAESTQLLFESYMRLVRAFAARFDAPVDSVPLWSPRDIESAKLLGRGPEYQPEWQTVSHRIAKMAAQNPSSEAVKDDSGCSLSYEKLLHRVQHISNSLVSAGVREGSRVAVFQEPTADWICSLLAIWHAGATYIPLDLRVSESLSRLAVITRTARPSAILCHEATKARVPELNLSAPVINVSELSNDIVELTETKAKPLTAAAVLFTSGSTGVPKGVVLSHRAFQNTFEGLTRHYGIGPEKVLQQSAFTFDFSLDQILCGLVNAGTVYVVSKDKRSDPAAIARIIDTEDITYTRATPTEYTSWLTHGGDSLERAEHWKFAWAGGEVLPRSLVQSLGRLGLPALKLYNSYGPAESITCTKTEVSFESEDFVDSEDVSSDGSDDGDLEAAIPVGFPLPNYLVFIVDHNLELLPQGASGEIVIGGPSVGAGYLNDEKLSGSKFIGNAYASSAADKERLGSANSGRILYRTGDVGRLRSDGSLAFQGRMAGDTMVKIRGMRADLREIENSILSAAEGALEKAVVSLRGGHLLVAHVQFARDGGYADEAAQNAFLRQLRFVLPLPVYMVPALFVPLQEFPTNAHGKMDRNATAQLALPQAPEAGDRAAVALSETEDRLLQVWKEVTNSESNELASAIEVTSHTSFFELGGNSLLLVKLQMLISVRFNAKLSLVDLFGASTLGTMAAKIETAPAANFVDWEQETHLQMEDFGDLVRTSATDLATSISPKDRSHLPLNVLVTGATGFLGQRLVDALAASEEVGEIHSVAVRSTANDRTKSSDKHNKSPKLKIYSGDLAAPRLGLSEADFLTLSTTVDTIIHAGAHRSLMDAYPLLRGANFESTKTLVHLAAARRIPLHFISSGSVSALDETDTTPSTSGSDGYVASKWASERYLGRAAAQLGLPVTVHRIVLQLPPQQFEHGFFDEANQELIEHVRALSAQMKVAPAAAAAGGANMTLDLIRVDDVAEQVVAAMAQQPHELQPGQVRHLSHRTDARVAMDDIVPEGLGLPSLPAMQWIARARRSGFAWQIASMDNFPLKL